MRLVDVAAVAAGDGSPAGAFLHPRSFGEGAGVRGRRRRMCALAPSPLWGEGWGEGRRRWMSSLSPSPLWGEGGGEGQRRWSCSLLSDVRWFLLDSAGRDMRPAAQSLSLSRQRKEPKKGDPAGRDPSLRCGQPAMHVPGAVLRNSLRSLRSLRSDNRSKHDHEAHASCGACARSRPCASRHGQRGGEHPHGPSLRSAPDKVQTNTKAERSDGPNGLSTPLRLRLRRGACGVARAAQHARASWSDSRGLFERRERSERSEFHRAPRKRCDAGLPRSEAQGSQTWGRFLCLLSCACKKAGRPAGARPGQRKPAEATAHRTTANTSNASCPSPQPSPQRGEGARQVHFAARGLIDRLCPSPPPSPQWGEGARQVHFAARGLIDRRCPSPPPSPQRGEGVTPGE